VARLPVLLIATVALLTTGVMFLAIAAAQGDVRLYLVLVIPVVTGEGAAFAIGALALMAGTLMALVALPLATAARAGPPEAPPATGTQPAPAAEGGSSSWGGVVFIGPIPIVLGSGPGMRRYMLVASVVMALLLLVFVVGALLR